MNDMLLVFIFLAIIMYIACSIGMLFGFDVLKSLCGVILVIFLFASGLFDMSLIFNCSFSTIVELLILGIGLMLLWIFSIVIDEREQKEKDKNQSNLA